jgi:membrane protease YdiL (CAAX protease family)
MASTPTGKFDETLQHDLGLRHVPEEGEEAEPDDRAGNYDSEAAAAYRSCEIFPAGQPGTKDCHNGEMASSASGEAESNARVLREVTTYFLLAYSISLALWLPVLVGRKISPVFLALGTAGPTLAALVTHRIFERNWRAVRIWSTLPKLVLGVALGASAVLIAAFTAAFFMTKSGIDRWQWSSLTQILTLFIPNLLGGPLGEEPGWRGFALPRLQRRFDPVTSSLLLGFLWANWHLPLIMARVYNVAWWQFTILTMAASVFLSLICIVTRGRLGYQPKTDETFGKTQ